MASYQDDFDWLSRWLTGAYVPKNSLYGGFTAPAAAKSLADAAVVEGSFGFLPVTGVRNLLRSVDLVSNAVMFEKVRVGAIQREFERRSGFDKCTTEAQVAGMCTMGPSVRAIFLRAINRTRSVVPWTSNLGRLQLALGGALQNDPDPLVRIEISKILQSASFPASWIEPMLYALDGAAELLTQSQFDQTARTAVHRSIVDARARLLQLQAMNFPIDPSVGEPMVPAAPRFDWRILSAIGAGIAALGGLIWWRARARKRLAVRAD